MLEEWRRARPDRDVGKQRITDQLRFIKRNNKFSSLEIEAIREKLQQEGLVRRAEPVHIETESPNAVLSASALTTSAITVHAAQQRDDEQFLDSYTSFDTSLDGFTPANGVVTAPGAGTEHEERLQDDQRDNQPVSGRVTPPALEQLDVSSTGVADEEARVVDDLRALYLRTSCTEFDQRRPLIVPRDTSKKKLSAIVGRVNRAIGSFLQEVVLEPSDFTLPTLSNIVYAGARLVLDMAGYGSNVVKAKSKSQGLPPWRHRLEKQIQSIRSDVSRLTSFLASGNINNQNIRQHKIHRMYNVTSLQQARDILELRKLELQAAAARLQRYNKQVKRKADNSLFEKNERQFYRQLFSPMNHERQTDDSTPDVKNTEDFWSGILEEPVPLRKGAWLDEFRHSCDEDIPVQENVQLSIEALRGVLRKSHNWKTPGCDKLHTFWWKKFSAVHGVMLRALQDILDGNKSPPPWFTSGMTTLIHKKGDRTEPSNYRPITCLPTIYKLFTGLLSEAMWVHINSNSIISEEQTGCTPKRGGCMDQLLVDQMTLDHAHRRQRNLSTCWIDFRKAYDSLSHEWLQELLGLCKFGENVVQCITAMMKMWRTRLLVPNGNAQVLSRPIHIQRGIFQGDTLSPLLFCLALAPISFHLKRQPAGYRIKLRSQREVVVNHLWYMDDLKLFASGDDGLASTASIVEVIGTNIGLSFNPAKCNWLSIQQGQVKTTKGDLVTISAARIQHLAVDGNYRYLGVVESYRIDRKQMKQAAVAEFELRLQKLCESQLSARHLVKAINTYAIPVILYGIILLDWTKAEIAALDRLIRKALTECGAQHPRASVVRVHLPRSMGGRGVLSICHLEERTVIRLAKYIASRQDIPLLLAVKEHHDALPVSKSLTHGAAALLPDLGIPNLEEASKERVKLAIFQREATSLQDKPLHGRYWRRLGESDLDVALTMAWLRSPTLYPSTESRIMAVQDQAVSTRNYQAAVSQVISADRDVCRMCGERGETIDHIVGACPALARRQYIDRHDAIVREVHWALCRRNNIPCSKEPRQHELVHVTQAGDLRLYWEVSIPTDIRVQANRPDIIIRTSKCALLLDVSVPLDINVTAKIQEKKTKYAALCRELQRIWGVRDITVHPIVLGALGGLTTEAARLIDGVCGGFASVARLQQLALLGTLQIVGQVVGA